MKQDVTISYFDRATGMQGAKDLLDRYHNLSPKVHIQYVDLLKNPTLARAENVTREGEAVDRRSAPAVKTPKHSMKKASPAR